MIRIDLANADDEFALGDTVSGEVHWAPGEPTRYKSVDVTLAWRTEGRGDRDSDTVDSMSVPAGETVGATPLIVPFSLRIPRDGPMSYDGNLMRIIWTVSAQADEPWTLRDDNVDVVLRVDAAQARR